MEIIAFIVVIVLLGIVITLDGHSYSYERPDPTTNPPKLPIIRRGLCEYCGTENKDGANSCECCGAPINKRSIEK